MLTMEESIEFQFEKYPVTLRNVRHYIKEWSRALRKFRPSKIHGMKKVLLDMDYYFSAMTRAGFNAGFGAMSKVVECDEQLIRDHIDNLKRVEKHLDQL